MKATGIVRRMDELGRVVIPKEIRKTLRIREGDPLEIFTDREQLLLKKYSPVSKIDDFAKSLAESLYTMTEESIVITDTDEVIAAKGRDVKDAIGQKISLELIAIMEKRESVSLGEGVGIALTEGGLKSSREVIAPIICEGDVIGAVVFLGENRENAAASEKLAAFAADFISRQF
ncbi:MAG: AbrB/MazE/SpoVT family DNA-binding domain-containing protein [Clostridia bacterium]|nr:AbrB/MazE/SpoVT family DNA-binding domain-containing protein [Clostridia bacterium]